MNAIDVKADYQFERAGRLFVRESTAGRTLDNNAPANRFMSADPDSTSRSHNAVIGHSVPIRPTLLNETRLGFNRFDTLDFGQDYGVAQNNTLGIKNGNLGGIPGIERALRHSAWDRCTASARPAGRTHSAWRTPTRSPTEPRGSKGRIP